jgi:hypothetical protein
MSPHRANIINTLQLISSLQDQLEYQEKAPVNVAAELVNQWFDDFYHPGGAQFEAEFSPAELALLARFNEFYDQRVKYLPDTLLEMHASPEWLEVVALAKEILAACGWAGLQVSYDP